MKGIERKRATLGGKPVLKGTRIAVSHVLRLLAAGWSHHEVAREYWIDESKVRLCLYYSVAVIDGDEAP